MLASQTVRNEVLKNHRALLPGKDKNGKTRSEMVHHPCAKCGGYFRPDEVELDHIDEVGEFIVEGPLKNSKYGDCRIANLQVWFERLFCDISNFQILCIRCHQRKTLTFNTGKRNVRLLKLLEEEADEELDEDLL